MNNSAKSLIILSNTVVSTSVLISILSPNANVASDGVFYVQSLVQAALVEFASLSDVRVRWCPEFVVAAGDTVVNSFLDHLAIEVASSSIVLDLIFKWILSIFFFGLLFISVYNFARALGAISFFGRIRYFLVSSVLVNLPFVAAPEILILFFFFFFTLYFSELHAFFIFSLGLSSDSLVYQFNFLLASFSLIFFFKFYRNLNTSSIFFSFVSLLNSNLGFSVATNTPAAGVNRSWGRTTAGSGPALIRRAATAISLVSYIAFFATTFIVWALRYVIQFVRLLVLYMIHTVFEFAIISNDSYFSAINGIGFFFFKSAFLLFFFFWGFMYLLVYLNLMFTLQAFIFFFFSEVFQSNFLFDLSAVVSGSLKTVSKRPTD